MLFDDLSLEKCINGSLILDFMMGSIILDAEYSSAETGKLARW